MPGKARALGLLACVAFSLMAGAAPTQAAVRVPDFESLAAVLQEEPTGSVTNTIPPALQEMIRENPRGWGVPYYDGSTLIVQAAHLSLTKAVQQVDGLQLETRTRVVATEASWDDLNRSYDSILAAAIPEVTAVSISAKRSAILLGVSSFSSNILRLLQQVQQVPVVTFDFAGIELTASRFYDSSPFSGGSMFYAGHSSQSVGLANGCSFAFAINSPSVSQPLLLTAGHCRNQIEANLGVISALTADTVYRRISQQSGPDTYSQIGGFVTSSTQFGEPVDSHTILTNAPNRTGDWAIVSLQPWSGGTRSTSSEIYVGLGDTMTKKSVSSSVSTSWLLANANAVLYTSGASGYQQPNTQTGRVRIDSITQFPGVFTISDPVLGNYIYLSGLWVGQDSQNGPCVQPGDSGGAVYRNLSDGTVSAVGIVSARSLATSPCMNLFTPVATVFSQFGGSIKTS